MVETATAVEAKEPQIVKLAVASAAGQVTGNFEGSFYMPQSIDTWGQALGVLPDKLIIPREYHAVINMCYDFYQRGGVVSTVVNRLSELSITEIRNGQRHTTDEANTYFDTVLHRPPSRLNRFIRTAALEYFLSGMVLPKIEWREVLGEELHPDLKAGKLYQVPVVDLWPPKLIKVEWAGWGEKTYFLKIPDADVRIIRRGDSNKIKAQQKKYQRWVELYPEMVQQVKSGSDYIQIDTDALLRKEVSFTEYPTPFLFNVLEALTYKQQLRKMDYSVASRVINAILLITEGNDTYPILQENREGLDALKAQIQFYNSHPASAQRVFPLFSNHTTKLQWIAPDVQAMLDQTKYEQVNDEISESLGFAKILITGESRNAQASEVSTWAIQPMMEELREGFIEWLILLYEEASELNGFRWTPQPVFTPIRLQDFIKTAAVFAQAFKEGNISRTTRDLMLGINFESEVESMKDEKELMTKLGAFPDMPYNYMAPPGAGGIGKPPGANKGGRPIGSQNPAINKRKSGVSKPAGQGPVSRVAAEDFAPMSDDDFLELVGEVLAERNIVLSASDLPGL